jgi:hypothetical protein
MNNQLRNKYLSRSRYNRYLSASGNDNNKAKRLYNSNIRLAQAFHPIITQFEVVLRNSLNLQLTSYFADTDWIINQKNRFMRDSSLRNSGFFLRNSILKSENKLISRNISITSGKIISEQTFGFWIAFFLAHHYRLIGGEPIKIFRHKPASENRARLYSKLDEIRKFRNRVNHCEPLCFTGSTINCSVALDIQKKIYELIGWIEPQMVPFFNKIDNVQNKINKLMSI